MQNLCETVCALWLTGMDGRKQLMLTRASQKMDLQPLLQCHTMCPQKHTATIMSHFKDKEDPEGEIMAQKIFWRMMTQATPAQKRNSHPATACLGSGCCLMSHPRSIDKLLPSPSLLSPTEDIQPCTSSTQENSSPAHCKGLNDSFASQGKTWKLCEVVSKGDTVVHHACALIQPGNSMGSRWNAPLL